MRVVVRRVRDVFSTWGVRECAILLPNESGKLAMRVSAKRAREQPGLTPDEEATASWVMKQAQTVELHDVSLAPQQSTGFAPRAIVRSTVSLHPVRRFMRMVPLKIGAKVIGVLRLQLEDDPRHFTHEKSLGVDLDRTKPETA